MKLHIFSCILIVTSITGQLIGHDKEEEDGMEKKSGRPKTQPYPNDGFVQEEASYPMSQLEFMNGFVESSKEFRHLIDTVPHSVNSKQNILKSQHGSTSELIILKDKSLVVSPETNSPASYESNLPYLHTKLPIEYTLTAASTNTENATTFKMNEQSPLIINTASYDSNLPYLNNKLPIEYTLTAASTNTEKATTFKMKNEQSPLIINTAETSCVGEADCATDSSGTDIIYQLHTSNADIQLELEHERKHSIKTSFYILVEVVSGDNGLSVGDVEIFGDTSNDENRHLYPRSLDYEYYIEDKGYYRDTNFGFKLEMVDNYGNDNILRKVDADSSLLSPPWHATHNTEPVLHSSDEGFLLIPNYLEKLPTTHANDLTHEIFPHTDKVLDNREELDEKKSVSYVLHTDGDKNESMLITVTFKSLPQNSSRENQMKDDGK